VIQAQQVNHARERRSQRRNHDLTSWQLKLNLNSSLNSERKAAMKFWRLDSPEYSSDYRASYINGSLSHPFGLPGVRCDVCGQTWGGGRVLPYEYPASMRGDKKAKDRWPLSRSEHVRPQKLILKELGLRGKPFIDVRPGDSFQPCYLDIPSRPRADFLWSNAGVLVVSERIKELLVVLCRDEKPFAQSSCER